MKTEGFHWHQQQRTVRRLVVVETSKKFVKTVYRKVDHGNDPYSDFETMPTIRV
jgi:hypothetical protein